jgi:hypothetical protein
VYGLSGSRPLSPSSWLWVMPPAYAFLLAMLEWNRLLLQQAIGEAYQDSEWGFGQVVAIMVWLSVFDEAVTIARVCNVSFHGRRDKRT